MPNDSVIFDLGKTHFDHRPANGPFVKNTSVILKLKFYETPMGSNIITTASLTTKKNSYTRVKYLFDMLHLDGRFLLRDSSSWPSNTDLSLPGERIEFIKQCLIYLQSNTYVRLTNKQRQALWDKLRLKFFDMPTSELKSELKSMDLYIDEGYEALRSGTDGIVLDIDENDIEFFKKLAQDLIDRPIKNKCYLT